MPRKEKVFGVGRATFCVLGTNVLHTASHLTLNIFAIYMRKQIVRLTQDLSIHLESPTGKWQGQVDSDPEHSPLFSPLCRCLLPSNEEIHNPC